MSAGTHPVKDKRASIIPDKHFRNNLPSTKTKGERFHIVLKVAIGIKPALRIEFFRIWEGNRIAADCPDKSS
jgi:hypothetical protein